MSKPRYRWWGYVRAVAKAHKELEKSCTAEEGSVGISAYGALHTRPGQREAARVTENKLLRQLDSQEKRELDALRSAHRAIEGRKDAERFMRWVKLVYWDQSHSIVGAAMAVERSREWGIRRNGEYMRLIAGFLGLIQA